jgi:hypothetical protein
MYGDINGYHGYLELYDFSKANQCEESRIEAVSIVAATSFGNDEPKSKKNLYDKLFKERNTCLEFVRIGPDFDIGTSLRNNPHEWFSQEAEFEDHQENVACFKFRAPLMVIAHLVRHRYQFSFNQLSRRYVKVCDDDFFIPKEIEDTPFCLHFQNHIRETINTYNGMIESGIKKEIARSVLPSYVLMSDMWIIGNKVAWKNLFKTRLSDDEKVQNYTKDLVKSMHRMILGNQPEILE